MVVTDRTPLHGPEVRVESPEGVLLGDERRRMRFMALFILVLVLGAAASFALEPPSYKMQPIAATGATILVASAVAMLVYLRKPRYDPRASVAFGLGAALGLACGYTYWGPFSMHVVYLPLCVFLLGLGASRAGTIAVLVTSLAGHLVGSAIVMAGLAPKGLIFLAAESTSNVTLVRAIVLVQVATVGAFAMARRLRAASMRTLTELQRAQRDIARHEAIIADAMREQARGTDANGPGRYTDAVLGSYRIGAVLGRGGMGEVYAGQHIATGERAAVKVLHTHLLGDPQLVSRFLREASLGSAIDTPHVVQVREVAADDALIPYIAMERLEGMSLAAYLASTPNPPIEQIATMLDAVAAGFDCAHASAIVHRDVKPHNIFRHREGDTIVWKILDFGAATLMVDSMTMTQSAIFGTPAFMAPEQASGERVDARCDVYGLGAVLYQALTCRVPYQGSDLRTTVLVMAKTAPVRPTELADMPAEVESVLALALAFNPEDRFASAGELARAFARATRGEIDPILSVRANRVLSARPWQTTPRRASLRSTDASLRAQTSAVEPDGDATRDSKRPA